MKTKIRLTGVLFVVVMLLVCACSSKPAEEQILGTWVISKIDGKTMEEAYNINFDTTWELTFYNDGTLDCVYPYGNSVEESTGKYTMAGDKIKFSTETYLFMFKDGESYEFELKGNKLTIHLGDSDQSETVEFEKK